MNLIKLLFYVVFILSNSIEININNIVDKVKNMAYQEIYGANNYANYIERERQKYNNNEIVARLVINSLDLDVPILQHNDNDFYLNHDEYGNQSNIGAIFLDYRNNVDIDRKLLLFGHNSQSVNTHFKKLENFLSSSFFNKADNRKVSIETYNKKINYEVVSVFTITGKNEHMKLSFSQAEWKNHIDWINESSRYDNSEKLTYKDSILIMQTCYYEPSESYLLVIAKKVSESFY